MHNNYYFLRQVSAVLKNRLAGYTLVSCFSQSRDELILEFNNTKNSFFIKASLLGEFSCLSFPEKFGRARKNSIDLFDQLLMKKVIDVRQFQNERSFAIILEDALMLLFKMHGNKSNIVVIHDGKVEDVFKTQLKNDLELEINSLDRPIDWSKEAFVANQANLQKLYFTFGKPVWEFLDDSGFDSKTSEEKWAAFQALLKTLENPRYHIANVGNTIRLVLMETGHIVKSFDDPLATVNFFSGYYSAEIQKARALQRVLKLLHDEASQSTRNIESASARLSEIGDTDTFKQWGDLIMANLHAIETGTEKITVSNFYDNDLLVDLKLDKQLSAQKNAERFYRKSKNRHIEIDQLNQTLERNKVRLSEAQHKLGLLEQGVTSEIAGWLKEEAEKTEKEKQVIPFYQFEFKGYSIWAGKDAKSNDELTVRWSHKNDLWLHARDVAGSHVIIRWKAGKPFPKDVIEFAASIAAYNSKRKTETLCPVIVTPRKFVRKRKGSAAGEVVVDREEVILVEPWKGPKP